jgi:UDP-N-acetyl-D-glucosamine dehydrogenase
LQSQNYRGSSLPNDLNDREIIVICVPTPLDAAQSPDLSYVLSACEIIAVNLKSNALIINESTSFPGTLRKFIKPQIEKFSNDSLQHLFAVSPERVDPGNKEWNFKNTPRLISGLTPDAEILAFEFYNKFCDSLILVSSPEIAEVAKLFENTFRLVNIGLVNELSRITQALGISSLEVLNASGTKPFGFMQFSPSLGVGGHCIPVDPLYLAKSAEEVGVNSNFITLAEITNKNMGSFVVDQIRNAIGNDLHGKTILVCGLGYKKNISDLRESPSIFLIKKLKEEGASVTWHDPLVENYEGDFITKITNQTYDATVICQAHDVFDLRKIATSASFIFDCTGTISNASHF